MSGLGKKLWVVVTRAAKSQDEIMKLLPDHLAQITKLEKDGHLFAAGPMRPAGKEAVRGSLGMFVLRAASEAEARELADSDPLHKTGARTYELFEWTMNEGRISISFDLSDQSLKFT